MQLSFHPETCVPSFAGGAKVTHDDIQAFRSAGYNGWLYLCPDVAEDRGAPNGFGDIEALFAAKQVPFISAELTVELYEELEKALDALPRPTVVTCMAGR
jgi:hypothetical protein